ncbi:MAG: hypothetical protein WCY37_04970 [Candidatus Dojkabacteria bacterium]
MEKIVEERIEQIKDELEELFGEYIHCDYDYNPDGIYTRSIEKVKEYIDWELENNSRNWQERSRRDRVDTIRLLSEYIKLSNK